MSRILQNVTQASIWMICGVLVCLTFEHFLMNRVRVHFPTEKIKSRTISGDVTPTVNILGPSDGKARVMRHDGRKLRRLTDFCTWTVPLDCAVMKTDVGPMPIYIHRLADDVYVSGTIAKTGVWEPQKMKAIFAEFVKYPNAGFVDIGSHVGSYSLQAAKLGRKVLAVDPLIENIQRLCKSVQRNKFSDNITIVFNPLSDSRTVATFRKFSDNVGATRVLTNSKVADVKAECDVPAPAYTVFLDELLPLVTFKTAIMKMDVEEHEYHVINGGRKFLQQIHVPVIFMEWDNVKKTSTGLPLVELMKTLKYTPFSPFNKQVPLKNEDYLKWPYDVLWVKNSL